MSRLHGLVRKISISAAAVSAAARRTEAEAREPAVVVPEVPKESESAWLL